MDRRTPKQTARRNLNVVMFLTGIFAAMVGLTYAAVPLYRIFCERTGFDGTPVRADAATAAVTPIDRTVTVSFNGDVNDGLPWKFYPEQNHMEARVGQTYLAYFVAENLSDQPITGRATYNVSPEPYGPYFVKIQCFCFNEQTLQPHERVEMPVTFYLDPAMAGDRLLDSMSDVTLSYSFFKTPDQQTPSAPAPAKLGAVATPTKAVN
jgi:cytochrome c oxidase assembly protein subunit 11